MHGDGVIGLVVNRVRDAHQRRIALRGLRRAVVIGLGDGHATAPDGIVERADGTVFRGLVRPRTNLLSGRRDMVTGINDVKRLHAFDIQTVNSADLSNHSSSERERIVTGSILIRPRRTIDRLCVREEQNTVLIRREHGGCLRRRLLRSLDAIVHTGVIIDTELDATQIRHVAHNLTGIVPVTNGLLNYENSRVVHGRLGHRAVKRIALVLAGNDRHGLALRVHLITGSGTRKLLHVVGALLQERLVGNAVIVLDGQRCNLVRASLVGIDTVLGARQVVGIVTVRVIGLIGNLLDGHPAAAKLPVRTEETAAGLHVDRRNGDTEDKLVALNGDDMDVGLAVDPVVRSLTVAVVIANGNLDMGAHQVDVHRRDLDAVDNLVADARRTLDGHRRGVQVADVDSLIAKGLPDNLLLVVAGGDAAALAHRVRVTANAAFPGDITGIGDEVHTGPRGRVELEGTADPRLRGKRIRDNRVHDAIEETIGVLGERLGHVHLDVGDGDR